MKRMIFLFLFGLLASSVVAQVPEATYEMKTDNFKQLNESTISWELWMRKASGVDFGLFGWELQWEFDNSILNSGVFRDAEFTITAGADGIYANHYDNANATVPNGVYFKYNPGAGIPNVGENSTLITADWKHIATFTAQLTKDGNPHNFASADISFAHRTGGVVQVFATTNPHQTGNNGQITGTLTTAAGVPLNTRELAGYWFTGEGAWSETARWNNVTTENSNQVPPLATNNAGIAGQATLTDARTVNQLTIAEEALLVLSGDAGNIGHLTVNGDLFNDNQTDGAKKGTVTIAKWDFEDTGQTGLPYFADDGIVGNIGAASFATSASFAGFFEFGGGTRAPFAQSWYIAPQPPFIPDPTFQHWQVQFSTLGYKNLKISSEQYAVSGGPTSFKLEYSIDGSNWTDVPGSSITVAEDWSTGTISDFVLPNAFDNISVGYLRWTTTGVQTGFGGIDNIIITGEELPPPPTGLLIASTADGTGSLIHNTDDVKATIERYIPDAGYHLVSVPFTQASNPRSGWFIWSYLFEFGVATQTWVSLGSSVWTPLDVDKGYMVYKYPGPDKFSSDTTYAMTGLMNNGDFPMKVEYVGDEDYKFNLVPNPYPSAIDWDEAGGWTKENLSGSYWIWKHELDQYATWNNGLSVPEDAATKDIPVGQSFFVLADNENPILTVNNGARVHSDQAFHKNQGELSDLLRLKAITADGADELAIHFMDYATPEYDLKHDAPKMPRGADIPQLYSYSADGRKLTINRLPMTDETISVTVGFDRSAAGEVTLEFNSLDSFDPDVTMFLWDMLTDTKVNLREKQQYSFMHHPDNNSARFALLFNSAVNVDEIEQTNIQMYAVNNNLNISIPDEMQERFDLTIYNTSGQVVFSQRVHTGHSVIAVPALGQGVYIARLVSGSQSMVKKLFLK